VATGLQGTLRVRATSPFAVSALIALLQHDCRRTQPRVLESGPSLRTPESGSQALGSGLSPTAPANGSEPPTLANGPQAEPLGNVFACYRNAHDQTLLEAPAIAELCEGAADASPVGCYLDARRRTYLSMGDAIFLCRCATSTSPVACYQEGDRTTNLPRSKILSLCAPEERWNLARDCSPAREGSAHP
jgi:hypothetical protein